MSGPVKVTAEKEFGLRGWTVRVDGIFIADFYREVSARRLAMRLCALLSRPSPSEGSR